MLTVVDTNMVVGEDVVNNISTLHRPIYTLVCEDLVENKFEIETNEDTYIQVTNFLDKLRSV